MASRVGGGAQGMERCVRLRAGGGVEGMAARRAQGMAQGMRQKMGRRM